MPGSEIDVTEGDFNTSGNTGAGVGPSTGHHDGRTPMGPGTSVLGGPLLRPPQTTREAAREMQGRMGTREPKPRISLKTFRGYKVGGVRISYADNKIGVLADIDGIITEIAEEAGVDLGDEETAGRFLDALVTDVYVNAYSDKLAFDGDIVIATFQLPRRYIKNVIERHVGTMHRRYARALAPIMVEVMTDNPDFHDVLDKRASELNLSTRYEAIRAFDGADALINVDRTAAERNAMAKTLALAKRAKDPGYDLQNSAARADAASPTV